MQQRLVDLSRSVLFACNDYPLSSLERIQALVLFAMYQWVGSLSCLKSSSWYQPLTQNEANAGESWYIVGFAVRMAQSRMVSYLMASFSHSVPFTSFLEPRWCYHVADATRRGRNPQAVVVLVTFFSNLRNFYLTRIRGAIHV